MYIGYNIYATEPLNPFLRAPFFKKERGFTPKETT